MLFLFFLTTKSLLKLHLHTI